MKGKKPEVKEKRLKMFVFGEAGVGKTLAAIQFPNAYIIDCEKGTDFYSKSISKAGSAVLQTNDPEEIIEEIRQLLTTKHEYKTLIIDPVTQIYNALQEKWNRIFEKYADTEKQREVGDFGMRYWGKVKSQYKQMQRLMVKLDMNIIATSHQKDVYGAGFSKIGTTYDSMKGEDYFFDIVFQVIKRGEERLCLTRKERAEIGEAKFPAEFEWSYENFCKFYGKDILEKESTPMLMATPEQVEKIDRLVKVLNLEQEIINKWFTKCDTDSFAEMTAEQIQKCIDFVEEKLKLLTPTTATNGKPPTVPPEAVTKGKGGKS